MCCREDVFRDFYDNTYEALYKYVRRMGGTDNVIEDIVQEAYCEAYRCREKLYEHPNPAGWLYKTANYIFRNSRRQMENSAVSLETLEDSEGMPCVRGDYEIVEWQMLMRWALSEDDSQLIQRYYLEGYSGAEIAAQLGTSEENVRMKLSRIRRKMREKLTGVKS